MMRVYVALVAFFSSISSSQLAEYASRGGRCLNDCGYYGYKYTWCKLKDNNWDYCSLKEGLDASGKKCDTPCDLWGGSYRYCHFKAGGWNYCSLPQQSDSSELLLENLCMKRCQVSGTQFQCETAHGLERCSPFQDVTPTGLPCHTNYRCAKYGWSAYRCHTSKGEDEWDFCRPEGKDGCIWAVSDTNYARIETCTLVYSQNKNKLIFRRVRKTETLPPTKEQFQDAVHLIDTITSIRNLPDSGSRSRVHFYKQQSILCNGINYTNVELWPDDSMNKPIAHVIFSEILSVVEVLRLAFYTSLHSTFFSPAYTIVVSLDEPMLCSIDHQ